jgi:hypothetical protein
MAFRACLRYIQSVMSASLVACPAFVIFVFVIPFCFVYAYEEYVSPGLSLSCNESAWNALLHDMKILPTRASFVSAVSKMVRGVDASN